MILFICLTLLFICSCRKTQKDEPVILIDVIENNEDINITYKSTISRIVKVKNLGKHQFFQDCLERMCF